MLFDEERLKEALEQYKNDFSDWFKKGKDKWIAVETFQRHWKADAPDFSKMLRQALSDAEKIMVARGNSNATGAIILLAEKAPEETRALFEALFDENRDVLDRIQGFMKNSAALYRDKINPEQKQLQGENTITTYLWLHDPDKYYYYKMNALCALAVEIHYVNSFRNGLDSDQLNDPKRIREFYDLYDEICSCISEDDELINIVNKSLADDIYYKDLKHKTLTSDFAFYIKQKHDDNNSYSGYWWIVAKPTRWSLSKLEKGETQEYYSRTQKGKSQIYRNFIAVKIGDKVIGYEATPALKIAAICEIAEEHKDNTIKIRKLDDVTSSNINYGLLKTIPELQDMEFLRTKNGSLFKLKEYEYNCIMDLINGIYRGPWGPPEGGYTMGKYKRNLIFFGAPGTGKSHDLNVLKDKFFDDYSHKGDYERVTFHPDYSYAHFVGTYKPVVPETDQNKGEITYEYVPGPFMRIYVKAKTRPGEKFLLIIEEINRANVAAVFGDIFQLLDRTKDGNSEYPIAASEDMKVYLRSKGVKDYGEVAIPPNMYIWATMNSADQGVFPMDTAFKRRWEFKYLGINHGEDAEDENKIKFKYKEVPLGNTGKSIEWNILRKTINELLASENINVNEDKQLGMFFIDMNIIDKAMGSEKNKKEFNETFKNKVLMYLFEDAAKHRREQLFGSKTIRYSEVCDNFDEKGLEVFVCGPAAREKVEQAEIQKAKAEEESKSANESATGNNQDHNDAPEASSGENN